MLRFRIVIEDSVSSIRAAMEFEAASLEEARSAAEAEDWRDPSWEEIDSNALCEIREEHCEE
ncbi:MAG: hypothetical protein KY475_06535 [Planctomycetes bacterium]|nr:hypothetical protein [Planctomycetota bacterium]